MIIAIIIPIYNRLEITKIGLYSLFESLKNYNINNGQFKYKVIVVDDGSTDKSSDWISQYYKEIIIVKSNGNLWWSGSLNLGINYAIDNCNPDYMLLWNDDTLCDLEYFINLDKIITNKVFYTNQ